VSRRRFRRAVRRLDAAGLAAFVADCWAARGAEVDRAGRRLTVWRGDRTLTVVAHDGTGPFGLGRISRPPAPGGVDADRVVTTVGSDAAGRLDPDDLYRAVLYGLPPAAADDCCRRHLGTPARRTRTTRDPETAGVAALVGLVVCAVVAGVAFAGAPAVAPTPTDPASSTPGAAPPERPGPTAASLGAAHAAALRGTGVAFRTDRVVRGADGRLRSRVRTVGCVSPDRRTVSAAVTVDGPEAVLFAEGLRDTTVAFYGANGTLVRATAANGQTVVQPVSPDAYDPTERFFLLPDPRAPGAAFRGVELRPVAGDGRPTRLRGDLFANATVFGRSHGVTAPRNLSGRAVVDDAGTVRRYRLSYDATFVDRRIAVTRTGAFDRTDARPTAPSWTDARGTTDASEAGLRRQARTACAGS
jgi:hypothetical protein